MIIWRQINYAVTSGLEEKERCWKHTNTHTRTTHTHIHAHTRTHTHTHAREGQARVNLLRRFDVLAGLSWHQ